MRKILRRESHLHRPVTISILFFIDGSMDLLRDEVLILVTLIHIRMYNNFLYDCIKDALRCKRVWEISAFTSVIVNYTIAIVAQLLCNVRESSTWRKLPCCLEKSKERCLAVVFTNSTLTSCRKRKYIRRFPWGKEFIAETAMSLFRNR